MNTSETAKKSATRKLADEIFAMDAQYKGNLIASANRDDFIDTWVCPAIERYVIRCVKETLNG